MQLVNAINIDHIDKIVISGITISNEASFFPRIEHLQINVYF